MLWLLTGVTTVVLLVIALFVKDISKLPTVARPAALAVSARTADRGITSGSGRQQVTPRPKHRKTKPRNTARAVSRPTVTDTSSGLSYQLLSSPWSLGCPQELNTPMFSWSAGESAVAGQVLIGGSSMDWYGNACSGQLGSQFAYSGPADLQPTAMSLTFALDVAYYSGLPHYRTLDSSNAMLIGGHQAWVVTFLMTYSDAASQGLPWTSEAGAVVVVDRGAGYAPAVFYVSVPSNLGTSTVGVLVRSLRLS
jgi:hypothetical protein